MSEPSSAGGVMHDRDSLTPKPPLFRCYLCAATISQWVASITCTADGKSWFYSVHGYHICPRCSSRYLI